MGCLRPGPSPTHRGGHAVVGLVSAYRPCVDVQCNPGTNDQVTKPEGPSLEFQDPGTPCWNYLAAQE